MRLWTPLVSAVCGLTISSCAPLRPILPAAPRLDMPAEASRPCELARLPDAPTQADLEILAAARGAALVACDAARRLAVQTHEAEHALEDAALGKRARAPRPSGG